MKNLSTSAARSSGAEALRNLGGCLEAPLSPRQLPVADRQFSTLDRARISNPCVRHSGERRKNLIACLVLTTILASLFVACSSATSKSSFDARISLDGKLLALMEYKETGSILRIRDLNNRESGWKRVDIPATVGSFNFGRESSKILITYSDHAGEQLARLDVSNKVPLETIHREPLGLAFPFEFGSDEFLFQAVTARTARGYPRHQWKALARDGKIWKLGPEFVIPYGGVSLMGSGFFVLTGDGDGQNVGRVRTYALPNGTPPSINFNINSQTTAFRCSEDGNNCVRLERYINEDRFNYNYKLFRLHKEAVCEVTGLSEVIDRVHLTSNGQWAVLISADQKGGVRSVVVIEFGEKSCSDLRAFKLEI